MARDELSYCRICAAACGIVAFMLDKACAYARERRVFKGTPIGAYQAIQHPLAECRIGLDAARFGKDEG